MAEIDGLEAEHVLLDQSINRGQKQMFDDGVCSRVLKGVVAQIKSLDLEFQEDSF